jgi:hypothetical protein
MLTLLAGVWLIFRAASPAPETVERQQAVQAFAPVSVERDFAAEVFSTGYASPTVVNLRDIPAGVYDPDNQLDRWRRGEIDLNEADGIRSDVELAAMREASARLAPSRSIDLAAASPSLQAPAAGTGFDSLDYTECCGGGGNVPPDPEIAAGPNHVIAVVNVAFEIYDTAGNSLVGPTTFSSFMAANPNCGGVFDPNVLYDEQANRFFLGIDADGAGYCAAVSQSGDPTGSWNLYFFSTGNDFFDYPHVGVGNEAIYMGGNIFRCRGPFGCRFAEARVWAFDKTAMYAGQPAASSSQGLPTSEDTPQPLNLHGWSQGTWPSGGPHYFFTNTNYNGDTYSVWSWNDPFGANSFGVVGTVDLEAFTGVASGLPVDVPQRGGQTLQANDFRPQDFEYRNGHAWSVQTIACNPGSGTVNCIRWNQIDPVTATIVDAGVYASSGEYRFFGDLAVDACDNMAVGYTKSSTSIYPGIWVTGRESGDPAGTLQAETQLKAGEIAYTSFEASAPRRWGDYTEMTIAPDGATFWYLGEYSKNTGTTNGRWGTYIGSFTYGCDPGGTGDYPPTATISSPVDGSAFGSGATISFSGSASDAEDGDVTNSLVWTSDRDGQIGTGGSFSAVLTDGTHVISAVATDSVGQTGSDGITLAVGGGGNAITAYIADLDAGGLNNGSTWTALVTILAADNNGAPVSNATVEGSWSNGATGTATCTTNGSGLCTVSKSGIRKNISSATFTVTNVTANGLTYDATSNTDPDGDSNGTTITVSKP